MQDSDFHKVRYWINQLGSTKTEFMSYALSSELCCHASCCRRVTAVHL